MVDLKFSQQSGAPMARVALFSPVSAQRLECALNPAKGSPTVRRRPNKLRTRFETTTRHSAREWPIMMQGRHRPSVSVSLVKKRHVLKD
jgi:hypothetical protein